MNTKYQELESAIRKAVPESMELTFGCETSKGVITAIFESQGQYSYAMQPDSCHWDGTRGEASAKRCNLKDFEIIGRELTLADCVAAIQKDEDRVWSEYSQILNEWDMSKTYSDQSDATKDFLYQIICK